MKKRCLVCNKEFEPCKTCESLGLGSWKRIVCCREHFVLNDIIAEFTRKISTKEICRQRLNEYFKEFGNVDFNDNVKPIIEEIMSEKIVINAVNEVQKKQTKIKNGKVYKSKTEVRVDNNEITLDDIFESTQSNNKKIE